MKWALHKDRADRDKVTVAFAGLTKAQAAQLLLAYAEIEKQGAK